MADADSIPGATINEDDRQARNRRARENYAKRVAADPGRHREIWRKNARKFSKSNPEASKAISQRARAKLDPVKKAEYARAYYAANREKLKARSRERELRLIAELRPYNSERVMRRNARKVSATPPWADADKIRSLYDMCAAATKETGIKHHVDHIVPLQSKTVCGLHVQCNLQVIPGSDNQAKGNRWWPDAWS